MDGFFIFACGVGDRPQSCSDLEIALAVLHDKRTYQDIEIEVPTPAEVTHRTGVGTAAYRSNSSMISMQRILVPGNRPTWEHGFQQIKTSRMIFEVPATWETRWVT